MGLNKPAPKAVHIRPSSHTPAWTVEAANPEAGWLPQQMWEAGMWWEKNWTIGLRCPSHVTLLKEALAATKLASIFADQLASH
jgi:hypothetical protein